MAPQKVFYLTREGLQRVREEFEELERRRQEFIAEDGSSREELDLVEKRLRDLSDVLQAHKIISLPSKRERDEVRLGAVVLARSRATGRVHEVRLVGTFEANPLLGKISDESPFGQALLGKRVGDEVMCSARTDLRYTIEKISYNNSKEVHRA